jgi:hypothetical protein
MESIEDIDIDFNKIDLNEEIEKKDKDKDKDKEEEEYELKNKLKNILIKTNINYKTEILKEKNLKYAHIYCKIHLLSGQISGSLIEYYIIQQNNMLKNNSSDCKGDAYYNNNNIEIKISLGGKDNNKFNYVQLRINHICDYILTAYYIDNKNVEKLGELYIFKLTKKDLKYLIQKYGSYAHGTKKKLGEITIDDLNNKTNNKEYSIRPKFGDNCWNELLQFKIDKIGI